MFVDCSLAKVYRLCGYDFAQLTLSERRERRFTTEINQRIDVTQLNLEVKLQNGKEPS
jgi:hypothetical protein